MVKKINNKVSRKVFSLFAIWIMLISLIPMAFAEEVFSANSGDFSGGESTSFSNVQYTQPSYGSFSSTYSTLHSGPMTSSRAGDDTEFYDLMTMIPPGGCSPMVVRSDLLEEQNVPVFCELSAVEVNPGIDVSRISRIVPELSERNEYISGVGFHPAQASIGSRSSLNSNPTSNNLGYVVIVLKQQDTEADMPDNISVKMSAYLQYDAENSFGIGQTEFYLPVMTDEDFSNNHKDYVFGMELVILGLNK